MALHDNKPRLSTEELKEELKRIWKLHIDTSSRTAVNLAKSIQEPISKKIKGMQAEISLPPEAGECTDAAIFDIAFDHIMKLMFENGYLEFRQTPQFAEWLKEVEKKKPGDLRDKWYRKHGHLNIEEVPKVRLVLMTLTTCSRTINF